MVISLETGFNESGLTEFLAHLEDRSVRGQQVDLVFLDALEVGDHIVKVGLVAKSLCGTPATCMRKAISL